MSEELEILQGAVAAVVYQNYDNGYAVLRLNCGGGVNVTVVGTIPLPVVGERLMVTGKWSNHSNFGRQFEAEFLERMLPQTTLEIQSYLSSRAIKGIGPKVADCALLFGFYCMDAFPMDVWMKRAMKTLYPQGLPSEILPYRGIAQQYLFHYSRMHPELFE